MQPSSTGIAEAEAFERCEDVLRFSPLKLLARPRAALHPLACAALAVFLAGCSTFNREPPPPCPPVAILGETSSLTQFRQGPGRDLTDVEYGVQILDYRGGCEFSSDKRTVTINLTTDIIAQRGPAMAGTAITVPYFIAVLDRSQQILTKQVFETRIDLPAGRRRAGVAEGSQPIIPFAEGKGPKDYSIMIGLQLTDEQLAWNRQARGGN
jgi:hypothetical protein